MPTCCQEKIRDWKLLVIWISRKSEINDERSEKRFSCWTTRKYRIELVQLKSEFAVDPIYIERRGTVQWTNTYWIAHFYSTIISKQNKNWVPNNLLSVQQIVSSIISTTQCQVFQQIKPQNIHWSFLTQIVHQPDQCNPRQRHLLAIWGSLPGGLLLHHLLCARDEGKVDRRDPANVFKQPGGEEARRQRSSLISCRSIWGPIFFLF